LVAQEAGSVRVTVCELPHEPAALERAWSALCEHTVRCASDLVLLPEFAMVEAVWERAKFDADRWRAAEAVSERWLARLAELRVAHVVGTRPVSADGRRFNQGYAWSAAGGLVPLRRKFFLPDEVGSWEASWFERGDSEFAAFRVGALTTGLNICTELWALETFAAYAERGVQVILAPRATSRATLGKWMSAGVVAAVRSGAYSVSSNRVDANGECGGTGWVISPDGHILASTSAETPFATVSLDLAATAAARETYPRYVFTEATA
jgi:N-carbamoylputrescine amidase